MMIFRINNWTKLALVMSLICSMFSFGALAQDKPMEAKARTALVEELKGVVSTNAFDEAAAKLVAEKFDARKDLSGKTRKEVIDLLWKDVKSVITDSGKQYQIYSIFAFYKRIPDEKFGAQTSSPQTPSPMMTNSKPKAVEALTALTWGAHPYVGIEAELAKLPGTKDIKAEEERVRQGHIEGFEEALKVNNKLTAEQKTFVRANFDQLIKIADKVTEDAIAKNFPTEQWIMEGLDKVYAAKFTLKELNELINLFDLEKGSPILKYVRQTRMAEMIIGNGGKPDFTDADKAEHDKFVATPLGKKFMTAYLKESIAYEAAKENAVRSKDPNADGFAIYQPENLNKLFNKFVAENYKK
jgi:hypothetical protein